MEPGDNSPGMSGLPWRQDTSYFVVNPSQKLLRNLSKEIVNSRSNQSNRKYGKRDSKDLREKMTEFRNAMESHRMLGD